MHAVIETVGFQHLLTFRDFATDRRPNAYRHDAKIYDDVHYYFSSNT